MFASVSNVGLKHFYTNALSIVLALMCHVLLLGIAKQYVPIHVIWYK